MEREAESIGPKMQRQRSPAVVSIGLMKLEMTTDQRTLHWRMQQAMSTVPKMLRLRIREFGLMRNLDAKSTEQRTQEEESKR
jgi:hypothetical protein